MKRTFYLVILFLVLFYSPSSEVLADYCDNQEIVRLKTLANYMEVTYDYVEDEDLYFVSIMGLSDELFVVDKRNSKRYISSDMIEGTITFTVGAGSLTLEVYSISCDSSVLRTLTLELPKFNSYSKREECKELESYDLEVCDPWYQGELNLDILLEEIEPYLYNEQNDVDDNFTMILQFVRQYIGLVVLGGLLLIGGLVILFIRRRNRSVLE